MPNPIVSELVRAIAPSVPFVGPEALMRQRGKPFRARLGANESGFGPSPKAVTVMRDAAAGAWMYADPESYDLRGALARFHGVGMTNVVVGEGIDGLLGLSVKLAISPGQVVVTSDGAYPTFNFHVAAHGGRLVKVPYRNDREDLEALLDAARREHAKVLYVANPDNPMGSWWNRSEIEHLVGSLPDGLLLLLDEAYSDTAPATAIPSIDIEHPQVLRFRTFSKAYGLAGARVGYCLGAAALIRYFEVLRNHYGINRMGQLGALAALEDQPYLASAVANIIGARERIAGIARANNLAPLPSATNFVTIDCGGDGEFARRLLDEILARDVFVRMPGVTPLSRCIRVSTGPAAATDLLAEVLPHALAAARR